MKLNELINGKTTLPCLNHIIHKFIGQQSCPETCKCQSPPRSWPGRRNVQGPGVDQGYCFHWCDASGFCGVGEFAKAEGQDCRPCRMKFYGY